MLKEIYPVHTFFVVTHGEDCAFVTTLDRELRNWLAKYAMGKPGGDDLWDTRIIHYDDVRYRTDGIQVNIATMNETVIELFKSRWVRNFVPITDYRMICESQGFEPVHLYVDTPTITRCNLADWCYQHANQPWSVYMEDHFYIHPKDLMYAKLSFGSFKNITVNPFCPV